MSLDVQAVYAPLSVLLKPGDRFVALRCPCGTETVYAGAEDRPLIDLEMKQHLQTEHVAELAALGVGPCAECGLFTSHLRAVSQLGESWLCETHAPNHRLRDVLGDPGTHIERGDS